jgi:hypothetical protein
VIIEKIIGHAKRGTIGINRRHLSLNTDFYFSRFRPRLVVFNLNKLTLVRNSILIFSS